MADQKLLSAWIIPIAFIVVTGILLSVLQLTDSIILDVDLTWDDYSSLLTNLAFIAILAERFIEVFLGVARAPEKQKIQQKIRIAAATKDKQTAEGELEQYRGATARYAMQISFSLGLLTSLAGVRTLQILFDATELVGTQAFLFTFVDILLTAGLIAGGSNGINKVTDLFGSQLEARAKLAKKAGE